MPPTAPTAILPPKSVRSMPRNWKRTQPDCRKRCPGGTACCLDSNVYHRLHICQDPACICHSQTRYTAVRA